MVASLRSPRCPRSPRFARRLRTGAATAALAAAVLAPLLVAAPASAHWAVADTSPTEGEQVARLPDEVTFTFTGALLEDAPQSVYITDAACPGIDAAADNSIPIDPAACTDYAEGDAVAVGPKLTQAVRVDGAPAGEYTMIATVTYSDGHSESLVRRFTAAEASDAAASETATPEPTMTTQAEPSEEPSTEPSESPAATAAPSAEEGTPADGDSLARNLPWIVGGVVLAAGAGALVAVLVARARRSS